jgi:hypothetical protein
MKKHLIMTFFTLLVSSSHADMAWSTGNLLGNIPDIVYPGSDGWLVQMYRDVGSNTVLSEVSFNLDGTPTGVGNSENDELIVAFTASLKAEELFAQVVDFVSIRAYNAIQGFNVYTVILDTDSWGNATTSSRTFVLDANTAFVPTGDPLTPIVYSVPNNNPGGHTWQTVIPEPGTMALLAMGMLAVGMWRRKIIA